MEDSLASDIYPSYVLNSPDPVYKPKQNFVYYSNGPSTVSKNEKLPMLPIPVNQIGTILRAGKTVKLISPCGYAYQSNRCDSDELKAKTFDPERSTSYTNISRTRQRCVSFNGQEFNRESYRHRRQTTNNANGIIIAHFEQNFIGKRLSIPVPSMMNLKKALDDIKSLHKKSQSLPKLSTSNKKSDTTLISSMIVAPNHQVRKNCDFSLKIRQDLSPIKSRLLSKFRPKKLISVLPKEVINRIKSDVEKTLNLGELTKNIKKNLKDKKFAI